MSKYFIKVIHRKIGKCDIDPKWYPEHHDDWTVTLDQDLTRNEVFEFCEEFHIFNSYNINGRDAYYIFDIEECDCDMYDELPNGEDIIPLITLLKKQSKLSIF